MFCRISGAAPTLLMAAQPHVKYRPHVRLLAAHKQGTPGCALYLLMAALETVTGTEPDDRVVLEPFQLVIEFTIFGLKIIGQCCTAGTQATFGVLE